MRERERGWRERERDEIGKESEGQKRRVRERVRERFIE